MPKVKPTIDPDKYEKVAMKLKAQSKYERGLSEATDEKQARKAARDKTLLQLEEVLDGLNESTNALVTPTVRSQNLQTMRYLFLRSTT